MTPNERLGSTPLDETIVHETGHLVFGLVLGITEHGIEFVEGNADEIARARFSLKGTTPRQLIIRSLAGMYCQAVICPGSMTKDLSQRITQCELFTEAGIFGGDSKGAQLMEENGFRGDWERICNQAQSFRDKAEAVLNSQKAHEETVSLFRELALQPVISAIVEDLKLWLNSDDEEVRMWLTIIYPISRARGIYEEHSRRLA
jgi:hypothetical protein